MIANGHATHNGKSNGQANDLIERLVNLEEQRFERTKSREPSSTYLAGESDRMNPTPRGIDPFGTDADYHYATARNFYLMGERGRAAVRNHPLVEQGINRLIANLKLDDFTLDVDGGDDAIDEDVKAKWLGWTGETAGGRNECDYEGTRNFGQLSCQSFFSQVQCGDILHLPLEQGSIQTWESHHMRTPFGHRPTGLSTHGNVHGAEVHNGRITAYHVTPYSLTAGQKITKRGQTHRYSVFDSDGNKIAFWLGFRHRFYQRRGISRLSAPRDAMNGFDDLNYANIKSALRRALISYLMESTTPPGPTMPFAVGGGAKLPQSGDRYAERKGLGLEFGTVEQAGEAAQVIKVPEGQSLKGWNANLPVAGFFDQAALLLTMLAVNLDLPLMFLLLDGSLVNFHGGRMTFDQAKMRFKKLQKDQISGLWNPTYEWKIRQWITPGSRQFDPALAAAVARGYNPLQYKFRAAAWPYVKPLEDAAGEDLAERRNLRSHRSILSDRGIDLDDHRDTVIPDRQRWFEKALDKAIETTSNPKYSQAELNVEKVAMLYAYGTDSGSVQLAISADSGEPKADEPAPKKNKQAEQYANG